MYRLKKLLPLALVAVMMLSLVGCGKPKEMPMTFDMATLAALTVPVGESITVDLPLPVEEAIGTLGELPAGIEATYEAPTLTIKGLVAGPADLTITFAAKKYVDGALALAVTVTEPAPPPPPPAPDPQLQLVLTSDLLGVNATVPGGTAAFALTLGDQADLLVYSKDDGYALTLVPGDPAILEAAQKDSSNILIKALAVGETTLTITATKEGFTEATLTANITVRPKPAPSDGTLPPVSPDAAPDAAASAAKNPASTAKAEPVAPPTNPEYAQIMTDIVTETNARRAAEGLAPLTENKTLNAAAELRATETATVQSHTRPDGTECHTVFAEFGMGPYNATGENLAGNSDVETAAEVVQRWMDSPPHKKAILMAEFKTIGVGVYYDGDVYRYCQLFAGTKF